MNIAFLINNMGKSELVDKILKVTDEAKSKFPIQIFYQNLVPTSANSTVLNMNAHGLCGYKGKLICCGLDQAMFAHTSKSKTENYLYLYPLSWLQTPILYDSILQSLGGYKKIFVPSEDYKNIVYNLSGLENIYVLEEFGEILNCLN